MAVSARIQQIYIALFGRPADPVGGAYYDGLTGNGGNLDPILTGSSRLSGSAEYLDRFTGMSNVEIVNTIYTSLFGHNADLAGLTFYVQALANGDAKSHGQPLPFPAVPAYTIEQIAVGILDGATGTDKAIIDNKTVAAELFTASLDQPDEIAAYTGAPGIAAGQDALAGITNDPATIPTQQQIDDKITALENGAYTGISVNLTSAVDVVSTSTSPLHTSDGGDTIYGTIGGSGSTLNTGDNIDGGKGFDTLDIISTSGSTRTVTLNNVEAVRVQALSDTYLNAINWNGVQRIELHDNDYHDLTINNLGSNAAFAFVNGGDTSEISVDYKAGALSSDATVTVSITDTEYAELNVGNTGGGKITHLALTATGGETSNIYDSQGFEFSGSGSHDVQSVTVAGTGVLHVDIDNQDNLATFDAGLNSGGVSADLSDTGVDLTITGSSAGDFFEIDGDHKVSASLGGGDDWLRIDGGAANIGGPLDGGAGSNTLELSSSDANTVTATSTFEGLISNFQTLSIYNQASGTINLANLDDINHVKFQDGTASGTLGNPEDATITASNVNNNGRLANNASVSLTIDGLTATYTNTSGGFQNAQTWMTALANILSASPLNENYSFTVSPSGALNSSRTLEVLQRDGHYSNANISFSTSPAGTVYTFNDNDGTAPSGGVTLDHMQNNGVVEFFDNGGLTQIHVDNAATNGSDSFTINLNSTDNNSLNPVNAGQVVLGDVETVNIGVHTDGSSSVVQTLNLVDAAATSIHVEGNAGLVLTNNATGLTLFDASNVHVGSTNEGVTFTDQNTSAAAHVTINGSDGYDTFYGSAAQETFTGNGGNDTFVLGIAASGQQYDTITDANAGDQIQLGSSSITNSGTLGASLGSLASTAVFQDYLDLAASKSVLIGDNHHVSWFQYGGDTYIVEDNSGLFNTFQNGTDTVVKLTGLVDLTNATHSGNEITIV